MKRKYVLYFRFQDVFCLIKVSAPLFRIRLQSGLLVPKAKAQAVIGSPKGTVPLVLHE